MSLIPRPIDLLNRATAMSGIVVTPDVPYGPAGRDKMDVYRPAGVTNLPVLVFFYGGSWQWGHRSDYKFIAAVLARQGFVVAVPDYRLYPDVKFPEFLKDCAASVALMLKTAHEYGGNNAELFLAGHSAGAYNAVMLGLNPIFLNDAGASPADISGVIGLSGPYDFLPLRDPDIIDIFSTPSDLRLTQPITFASEGAPPMFLAHGGTDTTVLPRNTTALAARLRQNGNPVEAKIYPGLGHIGIILAALPYLAWRAPVLKDALAFIKACRMREMGEARSEISVPMIG
jgi:acetyl esterase/lipase